MANSLLITKLADDSFSFVVNGDTVNTIINLRNDMTNVGNEAHFKTSNGANLIKLQQVLYNEVTIVDGATLPVATSPLDLRNKLRSAGFWDWNGGGGSGVDRFDELDDAFEYYGNDGKVAMVDESQLKLIPFSLPDTSYLNLFPKPLVALKGLRVNSLANGFEFYDVVNLVNQTILLGNTATAPSEDVVFKALELKANVADIVTPSYQDVLNIGNVSVDTPIHHVSNIQPAETYISNEEIVSENGASKVTLSASSVINENANERLEYNSNSITFTDKITGYISKLWMLRSAPGYAEFHTDPNKPAGSYIIPTRDEVDLKLNISDYNQHFRGKYSSLALLQSTIPTGNDGDYAIVDTGSGSNAKEYIWDSNEGWVLSGGASASTTDALPEGSINLYFTMGRALSTLLTGVSFVTGGVISATDTILIAFGKLQKQINTLIVSNNLTSNPDVRVYQEGNDLAICKIGQTSLAINTAVTITAMTSVNVKKFGDKIKLYAGRKYRLTGKLRPSLGSSASFTQFCFYDESRATYINSSYPYKGYGTISINFGPSFTTNNPSIEDATAVVFPEENIYVSLKMTAITGTASDFDNAKIYSHIIVEEIGTENVEVLVNVPTSFAEHSQGSVYTTDYPTVFFASITDRIVKVDIITGAILGTYMYTSHVGGICYLNGKIYAGYTPVANFNTSSPASQILEIDPVTMTLIRAVNNTGINAFGAIGTDGVKMYIGYGGSSLTDAKIQEVNTTTLLLTGSVTTITGTGGSFSTGIQTIDYFNGLWYFGTHLGVLMPNTGGGLVTLNNSFVIQNTYLVKGDFTDGYGNGLIQYKGNIYYLQPVPVESPYTHRLRLLKL